MRRALTFSVQPSWPQTSSAVTRPLSLIPSVTCPWEQVPRTGIIPFTVAIQPNISPDVRSQGSDQFTRVNRFTLIAHVFGSW
jgi:hypothetical protein